MSVIYVRTKPNRVARVSPSGKFISSDIFMPVIRTPYIDRLLNHHQDIELRPKQPKASPEKSSTQKSVEVNPEK